MAKRGSTLLNFLAWFTGVVVSLVVGFAMIQGTLALPNWLGGESAAGLFIVQLVGWVVIVTTIVSVVLALLKQ